MEVLYPGWLSLPFAPSFLSSSIHASSSENLPHTPQGYVSEGPLRSGGRDRQVLYARSSEIGHKGFLLAQERNPKLEEGARLVAG